MAESNGSLELQTCDWVIEAIKKLGGSDEYSVLAEAIVQDPSIQSQLERGDYALAIWAA